MLVYCQVFLLTVCTEAWLRRKWETAQCKGASLCDLKSPFSSEYQAGKMERMEDDKVNIELFGTWNLFQPLNPAHLTLLCSFCTSCHVLLCALSFPVVPQEELSIWVLPLFVLFWARFWGTNYSLMSVWCLRVTGWQFCIFPFWPEQELVMRVEHFRAWLRGKEWVGGWQVGTWPCFSFLLLFVCCVERRDEGLVASKK